MRFLLLNIFILIISISYSQESLIGKYDKTFGGPATLTLNTDSTWNYTSNGCALGTNRQEGLWTVIGDSLYIYKYALDPISLEFDSVKIYTDTLKIDYKNLTLYMFSNNFTIPFERSNNPNLIYLRASINGFYNCHSKDRFDFVLVQEKGIIDNKFHVESFNLEFTRDGETLYKTKIKGNQFTKKVLKKSLLLKQGDIVELSNFSISVKSQIITNFKIENVIYSIR